MTCQETEVKLSALFPIATAHHPVVILPNGILAKINENAIDLRTGSVERSPRIPRSQKKTAVRVRVATRGVVLTQPSQVPDIKVPVLSIRTTTDQR